MGVPEEKLRRHATAIARGRAFRHVRLRQLQWNSAEGGSVPMQTFLGKCELGQGDEKPADNQKLIVRREVKR